MLSRIEVLGKFGLFLLVSQIYFWIVGYLPNQEGEWANLSRIGDGSAIWNY